MFGISKFSPHAAADLQNASLLKLVTNVGNQSEAPLDNFRTHGCYGGEHCLQAAGPRATETPGSTRSSCLHLHISPDAHALCLHAQGFRGEHVAGA